ncbi:MAG TPA: peptidylprolyl isomerase [Dongiaceae bacterium]|nr:peptidylprolyl isomerase [Dongiaceae bacterium]
MSQTTLGAPAKSALVRVSSALAFAAFAAVVAFGPAGAAEEKKETGVTTDAKPAGKKEVAVIKTSMGTIVFEFLPDVAPKMVENFKQLAKEKFYDGTTFHRVINTFMIQGGDPLSKDDDPTNDGTGSGPRKMPAEFTTKYSHVRGMVSTARANDPNSGSCQFFVVVKDSAFLDNKYTIFGRVLEGMDVADKIANVPKDGNDRPLKNVVMQSVTVETR